MARKKTFAIIGASNFGVAVLRNLLARKQNATIFDNNEEKMMTKISEFDEVDAITLDSTNKGALEKAAINQYDGVIVCFGTNLEASIITVLNLIDLKVEEILAKARDDRHKRILLGLGLTENQIIIPDQISGKIVSTRSVFGIDADIQSAGEDYVSTKIIVKKPAIFDKTIAETGLSTNKDWNFIQIIRNHKVILPDNDTILKENDIVTVFAKISVINDLIVKMTGEEVE